MGTHTICPKTQKHITCGSGSGAFAASADPLKLLISNTATAAPRAIRFHVNMA
jgi:hypothetical protein